MENVKMNTSSKTAGTIDASELVGLLSEVDQSLASVLELQQSIAGTDLSLVELLYTTGSISRKAHAIATAARAELVSRCYRVPRSSDPSSS